LRGNETTSYTSNKKACARDFLSIVDKLRERKKREVSEIADSMEPAITTPVKQVERYYRIQQVLEKSKAKGRGDPPALPGWQ
jgi:hypothetical protein